MRGMIVSMILSLLPSLAWGGTWTLRVDGIGCTTAADVPVDCADGLAINRVIDYTIQDDKGAVTATETLAVPITMSKAAIQGSLNHRLHQAKYPPPPPPSKLPVAGDVLSK